MKALAVGNKHTVDGQDRVRVNVLLKAQKHWLGPPLPRPRDPRPTTVAVCGKGTMKRKEEEEGKGNARKCRFLFPPSLADSRPSEKTQRKKEEEEEEVESTAHSTVPYNSCK